VTGNKTKIGIVGGSGYTAGELIRLLLNHPGVEISFVSSTSNAGKLISDIHNDLLDDTDLKFTLEISDEVDAIFLCLPHGEAKKWLTDKKVSDDCILMDLSQDFRVDNIFVERIFVYGLPEINRDKIKTAKSIACPGCFATAIQLALIPLAHENLINNDVHVSGITGSTGAGTSQNETSHFSWRAGNAATYKIFTHQHLAEINMTMRDLQNGFNHMINFVPYRGSFTRGIWITSYLDSKVSLKEAVDLYKEYYRTHPFVSISENMPSLKQVVNTNKCVLHIEKHDEKLVIISILDNLIKGASGQAVQNMNLTFGFDETAGLKLKGSAY